MLEMTWHYVDAQYLGDYAVLHTVPTASNNAMCRSTVVATSCCPLVHRPAFHYITPAGDCLSMPASAGSASGDSSVVDGGDIVDSGRDGASIEATPSDETAKDKTAVSPAAEQGLASPSARNHSRVSNCVSSLQDALIFSYNFRGGKHTHLTPPHALSLVADSYFSKAPHAFTGAPHCTSASSASCCMPCWLFLRANPSSRPLYLSGPTKCFSCERDMIARNGGDPSYAWMGKPSKCFDCEQQLAAVDPNLANLTHGTKCFGCEEQSRATCGI